MPTPRKHLSGALRQRAYRDRLKTARVAQIRAKNMPPTSAISTMPSDRRWRALAHQAQEFLQTMRDEMEDYQQGRSEAWQEGEKGEEFQERIDLVEEALTAIEALD